MLSVGVRRKPHLKTRLMSSKRCSILQIICRWKSHRSHSLHHMRQGNDDYGKSIKLWLVWRCTGCVGLSVMFHNCLWIYYILGVQFLFGTDTMVANWSSRSCYRSETNEWLFMLHQWTSSSEQWIVFLFNMLYEWHSHIPCLHGR